MKCFTKADNYKTKTVLSLEPTLRCYDCNV